MARRPTPRSTAKSPPDAARERDLEDTLARLVDREARLNAILDTAVDGIITIDEHGIIESVNAATLRIFGYTADELVGQNVKLLMPPPYRGQHDGYIASYLASGKAKIIGIGREAEGLRKDGTRFPIDLAVNEFVVGHADQ